MKCLVINIAKHMENILENKMLIALKRNLPTNKFAAMRESFVMKDF